MKYLIVVDMQNDFTIGSLGSVHAAAIIPNVLAKVKAFPGKVIFTRDTHGDGCTLRISPKKTFCQPLSLMDFSLFEKPTFDIQTETLLFVS